MLLRSFRAVRIAPYQQRVRFRCCTMAQSAIDERDWAKISGHLEEHESLRDGVVKQGREVQKRCKQAVFYLHQGSVEKAQEQLVEAEAVAKAVSPTFQRFPAMRQGVFAFAMEEFVEAVAFKVFLEEARLARSSEVPLAEPEEYLSGVLDFTEELSRHAIQRATVRDTKAVERCRDIVDAIMGQFLQFDLRNSALRRKYDGLKYTLKKLENTMYELSLAEAAEKLAPPAGEAAAGGQGGSTAPMETAAS